MKAKYKHTNIVARDWRKLVDFYERIFGCQPVCGEAVPALRPAGILPAVGNKGKMPSPRRRKRIRDQEDAPE